MSSFTFADNKTGGRLTAICDAIAAGKLRTAAGILNEIAGELNVEAESSDGLLSDEPPELLSVVETLKAMTAPEPPTPTLAVKGPPADLQMCARGVHAYGPTDPTSGWRTCAVCQMVNVAPPENGGPIDMSARQ